MAKQNPNSSPTLSVEEFLKQLDSLPDDKYITQKHLSAWLEISESKLEKARGDGNFIPYEKIGNSIRYRLGSVRKWLQSRTVSSTSEADRKFVAFGLIPGNQSNLIPFGIKEDKLVGFFECLDVDIDAIQNLPIEDALEMPWIDSENQLLWIDGYLALLETKQGKFQALRARTRLDLMSRGIKPLS